ncbi:translation initiation factor IF-2 isoform X4 [Phyllopteryx taeniolatus]|uniref:translation initiation factor IF-2 isoform X4 n=1 Tax=Phyllopteryx taeniolatus TaxID=161469 RepID=UPI002AD27002|nr:translation initiation factor IF-2 isoform X4 [Phyllopteryx taeniolatus]
MRRLPGSAGGDVCGGFQPLLAALLALSSASASASAHVDGTPPSKIAVVGAGIGGSAAAHFLRQHFGADVQLDVYEKGEVGGRLATVTVNRDRYESGGAVVHSLNLHMRDFVKQLGLKYRRGVAGKTAVFDGAEVILGETDWYLLDLFRLWWRYGISFIRLQMWVEEIMEKFVRRGVFGERPFQPLGGGRRKQVGLRGAAEDGQCQPGARAGHLCATAPLWRRASVPAERGRRGGGAGVRRGGAGGAAAGRLGRLLPRLRAACGAGGGRRPRHGGHRGARLPQHLAVRLPGPAPLPVRRRADHRRAGAVLQQRGRHLSRQRVAGLPPQTGARGRRLQSLLARSADQGAAEDALQVVLLGAGDGAAGVPSLRRRGAAPGGAAAAPLLPERRGAGGRCRGDERRGRQERRPARLPPLERAHPPSGPQGPHAQDQD